MGDDGGRGAEQHCQGRSREQSFRDFTQRWSTCATAKPVTPGSPGWQVGTAGTQRLSGWHLAPRLPLSTKPGWHWKVTLSPGWYTALWPSATSPSLMLGLVQVITGREKQQSSGWGSGCQSGGVPFGFVRSQFRGGSVITVLSLPLWVTAFTAHLHTGDKGCSRIPMANR